MTTMANRMAAVLALAGGMLTLQAQDRLYYGRWHVNSAKSDLKGVTSTFRDLGGNRVEISGMGQKEIFVVGRDGKDYPWVGGLTISWRDLGPRSYETQLKRESVVISTSTVTLSVDGNTVQNALRNVPKDGGAPVETTSTLTRVSGGPGFFGTWRISEIGGGLQLEARRDGVLFRWIDFAEARCRFDGRECPLQGVVGVGATMSLRELGPRSFEYREQTRGELNYTSRFTLAEDGNTLIEDQTMSTGEQWHIVYERQP